VASKTRRELIEQRRRIVYAGLQLVSFREISILIFVFLPLIIGIFTTLVAALMNPGAELTVAARGILYTTAFTLGGYLVHHLIILSLPTGRMGVMEGESAVMALFSAQLERLKEEGRVPDEDLRTRMDEVREEYERQLDARFAAARGFVDEVVLPEEVRPALVLLLRAARSNPGPHLGPFQLPHDPGAPPRPFPPGGEA